ncbi:Condensin complex subunit [Podila epicladia]|nr:Condensin complex subunit [Podila epicladia]KAG0098145.1 Condensin complex subunit [Podila epicladia]
MLQFELDEELLSLQDTVHIPGEIPIDGENPKALERILNEIVDSLQDASGNITDDNLFDQIRSFIKHFNTLQKKTATKVWDIVLSGFNAELQVTAQDLDFNDQDAYLQHRTPLEMYGFLIYWIISITEQKATSRAATMDKSGKAVRAKGSRAKNDGDDSEQGVSTWTAEKQRALDLMCKCLGLHLSKIWTATHEKESFISLFFKPSYQILENKENIKVSALKQRVYHVLCLCIKNHNHEFGARTTIIQNLQYWEHTPEPMAELLEMLITIYDFQQLADSVLREVSTKEFEESIKDITVPKAYSKFLVRFSELAPKVVLKQMGLLIDHLDGESYIMRQAIVEVIGHLIAYLSAEEQTDQVKNQVDSFFDILEERFMDSNSYVRTKLIQVVGNLCDLKSKFPKRRQRLTELVIGRLSDKSFWTRKQAIKTFVRLIETHPYSMHGGELDLEDWEIQYTEVTDELKAMITKPSKRRALLRKSAGMDEDGMDVDGAEAENEEDNEQDISLPTDEELLELQASKEYVTKTLQQRYYADAIRFIHLIHRAVPVMCELLASTAKLEVVEAMDFFVTIHRYKVRAASDGIRKMVHLVWMKDNGDEAKSVRARLMECYWQIYLAPDDNLTEKENTALIARNLVSLTYGSTLAELTSLEQLLSTIISDSVNAGSEITISDEVIEKLWQVYSHQKEIPNPQRRGAIIILGMLAKAKPDIVAQKIEVILKIGLGKHGKADLALARYSCIALQRIAGEKKKQKGALAQDTLRLSMDHPIFIKLSNLIDHPTTSKNWFAVAEQALNTIYLLGEHPDILCGDIIKTRCKTIFNLQEGENLPVEPSPTPDINMVSDDLTVNLNAENAFVIDSWQLSQLLFIVGHVAMKHIVHMEVIEEEFKRRKAIAGNDKKKDKDHAEDELDQVVGTTEDEFGDALAHIRERELLFGQDSLLQVFGPLIVTICGNNTLYSDKTLQSSASLALCKLMCISAEFCEHNLQLLFTILEKSHEPAIRSNIIIALGDMAVCFNNLIDANIAYLYKRLSDSDRAVKKNTLMVLTHLILNGMVKVKGQLGEMAICLVDEDARISDLARLFFTELTSKDNAVYNNMPDIISHLSNSENKVDEESYRKIMRFLFELIKDKTMDSMIEKLCQRFKNTEEPRGWRDIAFCLSMLPYKNEKSFKRLLEGFPNYQDKVYEEAVFKYLSDIIAKGRAIKPPKPEMKPIIDEFESKLKEFKAKGEEGQDVEAKAISAVKRGNRRGGRKAGSALAGLKVKGVPSGSSPQKKGKSRRRRSESYDSAEDDDLIEDGGNEGDERVNGSDAEVEGGMKRLAVKETRGSRPTRAAAQAAKTKPFRLDFDGDAMMEDEEEVKEDAEQEEEVERTPQPASKTSKAKETQRKGAAKPVRSSRGSSRKQRYSDDDEDEEEPDLDDESEPEPVQRPGKGGKSSAPSIPTRGASVEPATVASGRSKRAAATKARRVIESSEDEFED